MKVTLDLDYVVMPDDRQAPHLKTNRRVTDMLFRNAVQAKYPEGIKDRSHQRTWSRIQKILASAVVAERDEIELDLTQVEWILVPLNDWSCPQALVSWLCDLRDHLEEVKSSAEGAASKNGAAKAPETAKV